MEIKVCDNRIKEVDYLKGFSIFTITLMHLMMMMTGIPSIVMKLAAIGGTGVHVFFLCSGIGLYMSFLKKRTTFFRFIKTRFKKIYVPYIIVVCVSFFLPWFYRSDRLQALLSHIFLYKMFIPEYEESFGVHFWFVSTIIQFYIAFIPMCKIKEKIKKNAIFVAIFLIVSVLWWIFCFLIGVTNIRVWNSFFLQYIWEFALGMVVADELYKGRTIKVHNVVFLILALVGIGLQAFMAILSETLKIFNDIPALIGYSSLALFLMVIPMIQYGAMRLSKISYEYFLIHILIFTPIMQLVKGKSQVIQWIAGIMAIVIAMFAARCFKGFLDLCSLKYRQIKE